jgi:hypothetical protein
VAALLIGAVVALQRFRRPRPEPEGLSGEEEEKLARIVGEQG